MTCAELIGISVDGAWCHAAFARDRKLHFPLLSRLEPKGDVARQYGVYRDKVVRANAPSLSSMQRGKFTGALSRQSGLIPVQTEFFRRWRICKTNKQRQ